MIKGEKEYLDQIIGTHVCPEHQDKALTVAWHPVEGWAIRCGAGHYPIEVSRLPSLAELNRTGALPAGPVKDNIDRKEGRKLTQQPGKQPQVEFALIPKADLATGELLSFQLIEALVRYAAKYDLDPSRGHVVVMYGQPYIGLDGYLYHAMRSKRPYSLRSRPLTPEEKSIFKIEEDAHAWTAEVLFADDNTSFSGLGIVTANELTAKSTKNPEKFRYPVVAEHPWQMAQKRAEWQALRRGFPIGDTPEEISHAGSDSDQA